MFLGTASTTSPSPKADWVRSVLSRGADILAVALQRNAEPDAEDYWINALARKGADLLNARSGGESGFCLSDGARARMAEAQSVLQRLPERIERNRASNRTTFAKPEVKSRMSEMRTAIMARPEVRAKLTAAAHARWTRPGERESLSEACRGRKLAGDHPFLRVQGESNPRARLSEENVRSIRARCANRERHAVVAADFGVSRSLIGAIHRRELWPNVD